MSKVASQERTYNQIFEEYGILPYLRGPEHYRLEELDSGEIVPVPTEIAVDDQTYTLHESGAIVATDIKAIGGGVEDPEFDLGSFTIIRPGARLGGRIALGESCLVEQGVTLRDISFGDYVRVGEGASVLDTIIKDANQDSPIVIGPKTNVWSSIIESCVSIGSNSMLVSAHVKEFTTIGNNVRIGHPGKQERKKEVEIGWGSIILDNVMIKPGTKVRMRTLVHPYDEQYPIKNIQRGDDRTFS